MNNPSRISTFLILFQDYLLAHVLELWTATRLLTDNELQWRFEFDKGEGHLAPDVEQAERSNVFDKDYLNCSSILTSQLRALIENYAAGQLKSMLDQLERRLLQRSQSQGFETFLISIILLNCAERMCWSFQMWNHEPCSRKVVCPLLLSC